MLRLITGSSLTIPVGTDAQQPGQSGAPTAAMGQFRYNSIKIDLKAIKIQVGENLVEVLELLEEAPMRPFPRTDQTITTTIFFNG